MSSSPAVRARNSSKWIVSIVVVALIALLAWWLWPVAAENPQGPRGLGGPGARFGDMGPTPVRVAPAWRGEFVVELKALGTVTAANTVSVRSRVAGELIKIAFADGQEVQQGQLLAVIDPRPYQAALQQAEGNLLQQQAQLKNAQVDLVRYQGLYAEDSIAKQTLDTQAALVEQLVAAVKVAQGQVASAKLDLQFTEIRAPISGRLGLRTVDQGNLITANATEPLVVITQVQPIDAAFTLPENQLPAFLTQVQKDKALTIVAFDRTEREELARGELLSWDNQIDLATGTLKLKARFANQDQRLFPNQFVNLRVLLERVEDALLIPSAALQYGSRGTFVYVVGEDNKVQLRPVEVLASDTEVTRLAGGVELGERLVLEGTDRLRDGSSVQVIEDETSEPATSQADA